MADAILKKLQLKDQTPILVLNAPDAFDPAIHAMSGDVHHERGDAGCYPAVFVFVASVAEAQSLLAAAAEALCAGGLLWAAYPKKSSKRYASDVSRDNAEAWRPLARHGFEPVRQVALDDDWSALRFRKVEEIESFTRGFAMSEEGKKRMED